MLDTTSALIPSFPVSQHHWAVVLAGGDGVRLRDLTRRIAGDSRPKQFCRIVGGKSLLSQTRARLEPLFPSDRQAFVVSRAHERFYREDLSHADDSCVIAQPLNRGTAVAIVLALVHVLQRDPNAVIGVFPCDHYYSDDDSFRLTIRSAADCAEQYPQSLILVGAEAEYPEIEYGWIQPGSAVSHDRDGLLYRVNQFFEKPALPQARALLRNRCLWNTFVIMGTAATFLELLCSQVPEVVLSVTRALADGGLDCAYELLPAVDFSRDVLTPQPHKLLVLRDATSGWADLGSPARVLETLTRNGIHPEWLRELDSFSSQSDERRGIVL
jgi:mannose-1-phosphate guanylyltransferase